MNIQQASTSLKPSKALIIHKRDSEETHIPPYYIELHDIERAENGYALKAGQPVSRNQLLDLVDAIRTREGVRVHFNSVMPENILFVRSTKRAAAICWYVPPGRHMLLTRSELKVPQGDAMMPGFVFLVVNDQLFAYCVTGNKRPTGLTPLMKAPFWNTYEDGKICLGTAKIKMKHAEWYEDVIKAYEYMWFNSHFAHAFGGKGQAAIPLPQLWRPLVGTKKQFPEKHLLPMKKGMTLQKLIDQIK